MKQDIRVVRVLKEDISLVRVLKQDISVVRVLKEDIKYWNTMEQEDRLQAQGWDLISECLPALPDIIYRKLYAGIWVNCLHTISI